MVNGGTLQVQGLREALELLKSLPPELVSKRGGVVRSALYASANVVRREAVATAPRGQGAQSGRLARNIILVRHRNPEKLGVNEDYAMTVRRGPANRRAAARYYGRLAQKGIASKRQDPKDAYYARFVEFGTKNMQSHASKGFMRAAFDGRREQAVELFQKRLGAGIQRAIKKAGLLNDK